MVFRKPIIEFPKKYSKEVFGETAIIAPDTTIVFTIREGIHPWNPNFKTDHKAIITNNENLSVNLVQNDKVLEVHIKCLKSHSYKQEVQVYSQNANELENPLITISSIQVLCLDPSRMEIFLSSQLADNFDPLKKTHTAHYDLQSNQLHKFEVVGFTEQNQPFWNSTSLKTNWTGDKSFGKITPEVGSEMSLMLNDNIGQFILHAESKNFTNDCIHPQLNAKATINTF